MKKYYLIALPFLAFGNEIVSGIVIAICVWVAIISFVIKAKKEGLID